MNVTRLAVNCKTQATWQCNLNYHIARVYKSESMPFMASHSVMLSSITPAKVWPFLTVDQVLVRTSLSARGTDVPVEAGWFAASYHVVKRLDELKFTR
jgi:hypothetical protein